MLGSGFSASLLAMIARRLGLRVLLVERATHPRFAIGESTSPLMNLLLEELAARYDLPRLLPLTSYGAWQRNYPEVVCGLKRGFSYFKHEEGTPYRVAPQRANQLLVAASPNDETGDTHWLRADVDHFLLREACALGADYLAYTEAKAVMWRADGAAQLILQRRASGQKGNGATLRLTARTLLDATGPRGALCRLLKLETTGFADYPATQALYSHFTGVARCADLPAYALSATPPYAPDDAAVHHIFAGGWMWVLRFNNGVTSAGIAVTEERAAAWRLADGAAAWERFLQAFPTIRAQFAEAEPLRAFTWLPRLSARTTQLAGNREARWALLPGAAAFVDPLFSTGMPLSLLGIERLARWLERGAPATELSNYAATTLAEADHTARFIAGCYAGFPQFARFVDYSMFYFAAASYSEMARRLERGERAAGFLAVQDEAFATALHTLGAQLRAAQQSLTSADILPAFSAPTFNAAVQRAIAPRNIAGLCDARKRNWYGVDFEDLIRTAHKLGFTAEQMRRIVARGQW